MLRSLSLLLVSVACLACRQTAVDAGKPLPSVLAASGPDVPVPTRQAMGTDAMSIPTGVEVVGACTLDGTRCWDLEGTPSVELVKVAETLTSTWESDFYVTPDREYRMLVLKRREGGRDPSEPIKGVRSIGMVGGFAPDGKPQEQSLIGIEYDAGRKTLDFSQVRWAQVATGKLGYKPNASTTIGGVTVTIIRAERAPSRFGNGPTAFVVTCAVRGHQDGQRLVIKPIGLDGNPIQYMDANGLPTKLDRQAAMKPVPFKQGIRMSNIYMAMPARPVLEVGKDRFTFRMHVQPMKVLRLDIALEQSSETRTTTVKLDPK